MRINAFRRLMRQALRLSHVLSATATVYATCDFAAVPALALEAEALMQSLPVAVSKECQDDMKIALTGLRD